MPKKQKLKNKKKNLILFSLSKRNQIHLSHTSLAVVVVVVVPWCLRFRRRRSTSFNMLGIAVVSLLLLLTLSSFTISTLVESPPAVPDPTPSPPAVPPPPPVLFLHQFFYAHVQNPTEIWDQHPKITTLLLYPSKLKLLQYTSNFCCSNPFTIVECSHR